MTPNERKIYRQERLIALLTEKYDGQQIALANAADIAATLVSRYVNGSKGIGEDMAAKIERNTGYIGWFSQDSGATQSAEKHKKEERPKLSMRHSAVEEELSVYSPRPPARPLCANTQAAIELLMLPPELRLSMPKNVQLAISYIEEIAGEEMERRKKSAA